MNLQEKLINFIYFLTFKYIIYYHIAIKIKFMALNKNGIFSVASLILTIIGIILILLGVLKYTDYAIGFSFVGIGFICIGWAFSALKGRV